METVSEEVIKAAEEYADLRMRLQGTWQIAKEAFIAGASYSKPIEHEQLPPENGKEEQRTTESSK